MELPLTMRVRRHLPLIMRLLAPCFFVLDLILIPFVFLAGILFYILRIIDIIHFERMPMAKAILRRIGVYPVMHHFYDPLVLVGDLPRPLTDKRDLPGFDLNESGQLKMLEAFQFQKEFECFPLHAKDSISYFYYNYSFFPVDAQYLYNMIRACKPKRMIEVGSGFSTLVAAQAFMENQKQDTSYQFEHICVEPFRHEWLGEQNIRFIQKKVEELDVNTFACLEANDILFIDSSHIIKPQGDLLYLYLQILPRLQPGVIVHIHDIYTPWNYPHKWLVKQMKFWNEQYLLEAFLSQNDQFEIIGALNFLNQTHFEELAKACPALKDDRILGQGQGKVSGLGADFTEASSFWMRKKVSH